jgi:pimeloyl-ACP methyl ester carboxylesterase/AraC-like DNA-binding protein
MDVLTDILGSLRLTGGVVIDAETSGDFCLLSRFRDEDCARFDVRANELIAYHYVRSGRLYASVDGEAPIAAKAGDIILLPRNDVHLLYSRPGLPPVDSHDLIEQAPDGPARIVIDHGGAEAGLYCGFLGVSTEHHPILDSLPPILKLDGSDDVHGDWIETSMRMLNEAGSSPELIARLSELFFAEAIRRYMDRLLPGEGGWLGGLKDPAVAKALSVIHSRYAEELDIETLARESGVSRTVLGERFAQLIGEPPMRYCARWRMRVAANMLRDGRQNAANVAYAVGFNSEAAFNRAFKREYGEPPATWRRHVEEQARERQNAGLPEQVVRYCNAKDGTRLAFSVVGEGPPLVKAANWLNHIEHDWKSPVWRHWLRELTRNHTLIRYDERANGLSDWDTPEISFDAFVDDLECVVDCAGVEKFDLLGISQGASVAIAYAVRHPEKVRRLLIVGGYAQGWMARGNPEEIARREALLTLTQVGWGADHPTYRQVFTSLYIPQGTSEQISWWNEMQRVSCSPDNAVKLQRALAQIDVCDLLSQVSVPTLIFHSKDDQVVPFSAGEYLAKHIPGATFVPMDGENHILLEKEAAWPPFIRLMRQFLSAEDDEPAPSHRPEEAGTRPSADGAQIG